jgi:hypothetical protein
MALDLSTLSAADLAAVLAHARAAESAEREARKAARELSRSFLGKFVRMLVNQHEGVPGEQSFKSGAHGWSMGGKDIAVQLPDGSTRAARVSILVRWEDTIPSGDNSTTDSTD